LTARGSTWRGFDITGEAGGRALDEAADAVVDDLEWG
jgi:hypothetical protein